MKRKLVFAGALLLGGIVLVLLPLHMEMTGLVLLMLGAAVAVCGLLEHRGKRALVFCRILTILASAALIGLMACMNLIVCFGYSDWDTAGTSEYAVVLGASVREDRSPSRILRQRMKAAMEFMERNPDAVVILSGGQGPDEPMPEAECMYETMLSLGADESRLLLEPESHTTRENLLNSNAIIESRGGTTKPITVITSEFHQRRAAYIAKSLHLATCPVSGHTDQWFFRVNYTLREVFAFVKAFFQGGMD